MEETYVTKAIVLDRQPFREYDSRVILYSLDRGRLELVARGTKKLSSKLAGHLEPFNLCRVMAVRGRIFDYIGGAAALGCFTNLKNDLAKITAAGEAVKATVGLIKAGIDDKYVYLLLLDLLEILDQGKPETDPGLMSDFYILKLLSLLGYRPSLNRCAVCHQPASEEGNYFDPVRGGLVCQTCRGKKSQYSLTISNECVNILRFVIQNSLSQSSALKISLKTNLEIKKNISSFITYTTNSNF